MESLLRLTLVFPLRPLFSSSNLCSPLHSPLGLTLSPLIPLLFASCLLHSLGPDIPPELPVELAAPSLGPFLLSLPSLGPFLLSLPSLSPFLLALPFLVPFQLSFGLLDSTPFNR